MSDPLVVCIMLTRDRPAMAARAVRCFREQTYSNKELLIFNTGERGALCEYEDEQISVVYSPQAVSIGCLRNAANRLTDHALGIEAEILTHFDDDDISHPNRIAEQVALLQLQTEIVGYHSMYFVDERPGGKVWRYQADPGYAVGASLMYRRYFWERKPFEDRMVGEDNAFQLGEHVATADGCEPMMMVARIHAESVCAKAGFRNMKRFERDEGSKVTAGPFSEVKDAAIIEQARAMLQ